MQVSQRGVHLVYQVLTNTVAEQVGTGTRIRSVLGADQSLQTQRAYRDQRREWIGVAVVASRHAAVS
jgi:hypothetical protein